MTSKNDDKAMKSLAVRLLQFKHPDTTHAKPESWNDSIGTPLLERTRKLLESIPREQQEYGLALTELQIRLKGRKGKACHPGELADCLRKLGYTRKRYWRESRDGFQARWFPKY